MKFPCIFLLFCLLLCGCGYHTGYTLTGGFQSIFIPVFENQTLRREIEYSITRTLIQKAQVKGGLLLCSSAEKADTTLVGKILRFDKTVLSEGSGNKPLEASITLSVQIRLIYNKTGEVLLEKQVEDSRPFLIGAGERESKARELAFENLAEKILYNLEQWE